MRNRSTTVGMPDIYDEKVKRTPVNHKRTVRRDNAAVITSGQVAKFQPLKMIPLLREDAVQTSTLTVNFQMAETANMLISPVRASAVAYLVPKLAFERYNGFESLDRSYNGQQEADGNVLPWFETMTPDFSTGTVLNSLGLHAATGADVNSDYVEAYNAVWNYIATQRSTALTPRTRLDQSLAPAFWEHSQMKHVKHTFDDALIAGEVDLAVTDSAITLTSVNSGTDGANKSYPTGNVGQTPGPGNDWSGLITAELQENGVSISLANIELAKKTAAWARLRTQYQGLDEDWMMDQLLAGVRMPYENLKHPILVDQQDTIFGMSQRYATDSGNLDKSATEGQTAVQLRLRVPPLQTGGVIVVCGQCLPEMLYERQRDYYFMADAVSDLPNRTADELDPQPVSVVTCGEVDEKHSFPDDIFGYAPLNHEWQRNSPAIGGRYYRENPNATWTEARNRIWDTSVVDPRLGTDFYLATTVEQEVFMDKTADPFEFWLSGIVNVDGLTYFGPALLESSGDYDAVDAQVDKTRIDPVLPPASNP